MKKIITFQKFNQKRKKWAKSLSKDIKVNNLSNKLYISADKHNFCYLYNWLGEPMLQTPDDIITLQEIMIKTKPDIIVEVKAEDSVPVEYLFKKFHFDRIRFSKYSKAINSFLGWIMYKKLVFLLALSLIFLSGVSLGHYKPEMFSIPLSYIKNVLLNENKMIYEESLSRLNNDFDKALKNNPIGGN